MTRVAILGSTGSIGTQALDVISRNPELFSVAALTSWSNEDTILAQCRRFRPEIVAVSPLVSRSTRLELESLVRTVVTGQEGILEALLVDADIVVMAITGFAALLPALKAAELGRRIALANKECIVAGGELLRRACDVGGAEIIPVDSEHSAVFQCLQAAGGKHLKRIILTASGGPFYGRTRQELELVTAANALQHPNWKMGSKVTIDSATLMNKGLEVIEAHHLFSIPYDDITVTVHRESIIHSMVELSDGSVLAQMGLPDMRLPIQYALTYPDRVASPVGRFQPWEHPSLTFAEPDLATFSLLRLAYEVGRAGGSLPAVMSSANEVAVPEFLAGRIGFLDIARVVEDVVSSAPVRVPQSVPEILEIDSWAREMARARMGEK
jgi:1-deoxy-D-xylulose-5-phosphate reductoisomerase